MAATYKTQGTIASVSLGNNKQVTFTIEPAEPYDFPITNNGETKKYILLEKVHENLTSRTEEITLNNDGPETLPRLSPNSKFTSEFLPFEALIAIKHNRSKVEVEVDGKCFEKESDSPNDSVGNNGDAAGNRDDNGTAKDISEAGKTATSGSNSWFAVIKFTVK